MTMTSTHGIGATAPADPQERPHPLGVGHRLDEFELLEVIGEGGFGIVYRAYDHSLQREVAIKEYMPSMLARRVGDNSVHVRSERLTATFQAGLRSFINEARTLAQFSHPALVRVHRFWESNSTAYMAIQLYRGRTLRRLAEEEPARSPSPGCSACWGRCSARSRRCTAASAFTATSRPTTSSSSRTTCRCCSTSARRASRLPTWSTRWR
jgi:non-specific serine/threonine protein kinase